MRKYLLGISVSLAVFFIFQWASIYRDFSYLDAQREQLEDRLLLKKQELEKLQMDLRSRELEIERFQLHIQDMRRLTSVRRTLMEEDLKVAFGSSIPNIYVITPTYYRPTQRADLTGLAQTLNVVPRLWWIVVEDAEAPSAKLTEFLNTFDLRFSHIAVATPPQLKLNSSDPRWWRPRGVEQRNLGLRWLRTNLGTHVRSPTPIIYFADDDNTYHTQIFNEMRKIKTVGVWPVGLSAKLMVERPIVSRGKVVGFLGWDQQREFGLDMAAFAVNYKLIVRFNPSFSTEVARGQQETHFLSQMVKREDLEPLAVNCTKVWVWHTQTAPALLKNEEKLRKQGRRSDDGIDV